MMNPLKTRARIGVAGAAFVLTASLAGCGSSATPAATSSSSHQPVTITLSGWTSSPVEATLMQKELGYFEKQYPWIHVKYRPISGNYGAIMKTRFVAGDAADVIYVNNGGESSSFMKNGDLVSLTPYIKKSHFPIQDFYPSALSLFESNGQIYGIPKDQSPLALFYNPAMFKAAGITSPPTTWAQLQQDAKLLTNPAQHRYGLVNSAQEPRWAPFIYQAGGSIMNSNMTQMTLNTPQALNGFSFFVNLYRKGYAALPATVGAGWGGQAFGMGRAAMTLSGNWAVPFLEQTYPKTPFAIAKLPQGPANAETLVFPVAYGITKDSQHPNASWDLIRYLTSQTGMTKWMNLGLALPTRKSLTSLPYYQQHPVLTPLLQELPISVAWTFPAGFSQYSSTTLTNQTTLAIMGKETPAKALQILQQDGTSILQAGG
ncbi:MAG: extracellular solute-binding protein [Thermaerobacter sp.]|nr:extracellular solute-binding protein [Thermaerobacter sp.]